jgi:uncharacterized damage-inducible protein DinB
MLSLSEMKDHLALLLSHEFWANERIIHTMRSLEVTPPKAIELFDHILGAHDNWLARLKDEQPHLSIWDNHAHDNEYVSQAKHFFVQWMEMIDAHDPMSFSISYQNSRGEAFSNTLYEIVVHLCLHSQYHRGQIVSAIRPHISAIPSMDMIAYMRSLKKVI